jgi:hypothetical protein
MYTIPEDCPPRISHEANDFLTSENLFSRAKSLTDSSEIVITHEFSFEDIPEGIPLEDPIYDALNRDEIAYLTKLDNAGSTKIENYDKDKYDSDKIDNIQSNVYDNITLSETAVNIAQIKHNANYKTSNDNNYGPEINNYGPTNLHAQNTEMNIHKETFNDKPSYIDNDAVNTSVNASFNSINVGSDDKTERNSNLYQKYDDTNIASEDMQSGDQYNYKGDLTTTNENNDGLYNTGMFETGQSINENSVNSNVPTATYNNIYSNANGLISNTDFIRKDPNNMGSSLENPNLSSFHVVDSHGDLEVPSGVEGPVPSIVLPPPNFVPVLPPPGMLIIIFLPFSH